MSETKKCAHEACTCTAAHDSNYCSGKCKDSKDVTELACQCQHSGCTAAALKP